MTEIKIGQIWVEMDPRDERYVKITAAPTNSFVVTVIRVTEAGEPWPKGRKTFPQRVRFNGKRGGYALHRDVEAQEKVG